MLSHRGNILLNGVNASTLRLLALPQSMRVNLPRYKFCPSARARLIPTHSSWLRAISNLRLSRHMEFEKEGRKNLSLTVSVLRGWGNVQRLTVSYPGRHPGLLHLGHCRSLGPPAVPVVGWVRTLRRSKDDATDLSVTNSKRRSGQRGQLARLCGRYEVQATRVWGIVKSEPLCAC
jgi:hypothetical protein